MIIRKYGIKLVRIKAKDIELIRRKRNSSDISSFMHYREKITPAMQKKWFRSICNMHNNYFIIHYRGKKIGLVNGKNSDHDKRESEGGMFIWDKNYWDSWVPALASIIMSDYTFFVNNFRRNYIMILDDNKKAIAHNRLLGYKLTNRKEKMTGASWYVLTKNDYAKKVARLRRGIYALTSDDKPLFIENISLADESRNELRTLYSELPADIKRTVNEILKREKRKPL